MAYSPFLLSLNGDSYADYVRLASGPGSILSYTLTTLNRNLGIYGGQLQFADGTSLSGLTVALSMNSTLVGPNLRVTTLELYVFEFCGCDPRTNLSRKHVNNNHVLTSSYLAKTLVRMVV